MKSIIIENQQTKKYPYIGKYNLGDSIVLFTSHETGTLLTVGIDNTIGTHSTSWSESDFTIIDSITIKFDS